jgi:hypothetical protein
MRYGNELMTIITLDEVATIEAEYSGHEGKPSLGRAFDLLLCRWSEGGRDRETALRLMFLAWYANAEPPYLTGLQTSESTNKVLLETLDSLGGKGSMDAEVCFAVGLMVQICSWCFGSDAGWTADGAKMLERAQQMKPKGLPPEHYTGRGAYGDYFSHIARTGAFSR